MNEQLYAACFEEATKIVSTYRATIPEGMEFLNGTVGGSSGDSSMKRKGTTLNVRSSTMPTFLSDIITDQVKNAALPADMSAASDQFLTGLIKRDNTVPLGREYVDKALGGLEPDSFEGRSNLVTAANRNPFTDDYETATAGKFQDTVKQALAQVSTGPDVVRGGTARNAITQGVASEQMARNRTDEVRKAQAQDAQIAATATQILSSIEQGRRALLLQGQDQVQKQYLAGVGQSLQANDTLNQRSAASGNLYNLATRVLGSDVSATSEDLEGKGSQSTSSWNAGINCCFIFMEAYNGQLPWFVRRARDIFYDECPARGVGYTKMASWLVPAMRRSKVVRMLVNTFMIKPCTNYGAWLFGDESAKAWHRLMKPVVYGWFKFWQFYGKV